MPAATQPRSLGNLLLLPALAPPSARHHRSATTSSSLAASAGVGARSSRTWCSARTRRCSRTRPCSGWVGAACGVCVGRAARMAFKRWLFKRRPTACKRAAVLPHLAHAAARKRVLRPSHTRARPQPHAPCNAPGHCVGDGDHRRGAPHEEHLLRHARRHRRHEYPVAAAAHGWVGHWRVAGGCLPCPLSPVPCALCPGQAAAVCGPCQTAWLAAAAAASSRRALQQACRP